MLRVTLLIVVVLLAISACEVWIGNWLTFRRRHDPAEVCPEK